MKGFYTYWKNHGAKTIFCKNKIVLQKKRKIGDIVQLRSRKEGWHHSIIISADSRQGLCYAAHSKPRQAVAISTIKGQNGYCIIRIR